MFLFRGFLYAALLWLAIILITRDKEGFDYTECVPWVAASLVAMLIVRALAYAADLPEVLAWILHSLAGLAVLWFFVSRAYGSRKTTLILLAYVGLNVLLVLPRMLGFLTSA